MAKKSITSKRDSPRDLYLIELLSEPVKRSNIKKLYTKTIKRSEQLLQSIILNELMSNVSITVSTTTT